MKMSVALFHHAFRVFPLIFFLTLTTNCQDVNWTELMSELQAGSWFHSRYNCEAKELSQTESPETDPDQQESSTELITSETSLYDYYDK